MPVQPLPEMADGSIDCGSDLGTEFLDRHSRPGRGTATSVTSSTATASPAVANEHCTYAWASTPVTGQDRAVQEQRITRRSGADNSPVPLAGAADSQERVIQQPAAQQPTAAQAPSALKDGLVQMFLTAEEGPVASLCDGAATAATVGYCLSLDPVVKDLWSEHEAEIKRRCGPSMPKKLIDRQEVFGFALNNGLGRLLLPPEDARTVGQAGDNAVAGAMGSGKGQHRRPGKLERARAAAREALRSARAAAAKDPAHRPRALEAEQAEAKAVAAVLAAPVDLKLPNATVGAKRKRAATEPVVPALAEAEAAPPTLAELEAAVAAAQDAWERAEAVQCADELRVDRAKRRRDAVGEPPDMGYYDIRDRCEAKADQAEAAYEAAYDEMDSPGPYDPPYEATFEAACAEAKRLWKEHCAPFEQAEAAVRAAEDEAFESRQVAGVARDALLRAKSAVTAAERAARWSELEDENKRLRREVARLKARHQQTFEVLCTLRAACQGLVPFVESYASLCAEAEAWQDAEAADAAVAAESSSGEDQLWDEEMVARAEAEMHRTAGAIGVRHVAA